MKINNIQINNNFKNTSQSNQVEKNKPEVIDKFLDLVKNQDDVNDCVAVPRGIFKAYLWIMSGFGLIGIAGALPAKFKTTKSALAIIGNVCNIISALYFAKPFAFKGVSPTIKAEDLNKKI